MNETGVCSQGSEARGLQRKQQQRSGLRSGGSRCRACLPALSRSQPASVALLSGPRELCLHLGDSLETRSSSPAFLIPGGRAPPAPQNPCACANHTMSLHAAAATQSRRKRPPAPVTVNSNAHTFRSSWSTQPGSQLCGTLSERFPHHVTSSFSDPTLPAHSRHHRCLKIQLQAFTPPPAGPRSRHPVHKPSSPPANERNRRKANS